MPPETAGPPHQADSAARVISTSPLTVLICSRASEPVGASDGRSLTSNSELTSPLVEFASMCRRVPGRTPRRTSPETDWSLICPSGPRRSAGRRRRSWRRGPRPRRRSRSRPRRASRDRAADRAEADVAGDGLDARLAVDCLAADVAARGLHAQAGDLLDGDVAGGGLHLDLAEPARGGDVGGRGHAVEVGAFGAADADADLRRAAERDPGRADAEALAAGADLDQRPRCRSARRSPARSPRGWRRRRGAPRARPSSGRSRSLRPRSGRRRS